MLKIKCIFSGYESFCQKNTDLWLKINTFGIIVWFVDHKSKFLALFNTFLWSMCFFSAVNHVLKNTIFDTILLKWFIADYVHTYHQLLHLSLWRYKIIGEFSRNNWKLSVFFQAMNHFAKKHWFMSENKHILDNNSICWP